MVFVDEARIFVKAGDGGRGCKSFYRDKYMRHPIPDGGDGGRGGDICLLAARSVQTLLDFKYKQHYKADKGAHASSNGKKGRTGKPCILRVPPGTIIRDHETGLMIKDLTQDGQKVVVAKGGAGGIGNKNSKVVKPSKPGEELTIFLELKLIADVGLVGFPNAGKSTLICGISRVRSKIANYPFTTKKPILGFVLMDDDFEFVVADLPGIIEGAHEGKGLGHRFLKHAERTKIIIHIIDMAAQDQRDPLDDYAKINYELTQYSDTLNDKHKILVANKMDLPEARDNLKRFKKKYKENIIEVSAIESQGFEPLLELVKEKLCQENFQET